jgi:hypothetical protein
MVSSQDKINKGVRFDHVTWIEFSKAAIEVGSNRSRLLNKIVQEWLHARKAKTARK